MRFVDRVNEIATLEKEYKRDNASMVVIFGRRRVGKTELIRHFIQDKPSLYFLATEEAEAMNRMAFQEQVADFLNSDLLRNSSIDRWEPLFQQLVLEAADQRLVMVIDEFWSYVKI